MPDPEDETDDAMDSLSWPDTSRPIISNRVPFPSHDPYLGYPDHLLRGRPRRWWPRLVGLGVAILVVIVVVWLLV